MPARRKSSPSSRRPLSALQREIEFLRAEVGRLRELVALLQTESATHIRRVSEEQYALDVLKKTSASSQSSGSRPPRGGNGPAKE